MQDFGEHARELISSEVGLRLLRALADDSALQALLRASGYWSTGQVAALASLLRCCVTFKARAGWAWQTGAGCAALRLLCGPVLRMLTRLTSDSQPGPL